MNKEKNKTIQEKNQTEQTARSRLKNKEDINKIIFDFFRLVSTTSSHEYSLLNEIESNPPHSSAYFNDNENIKK